MLYEIVYQSVAVAPLLNSASLREILEHSRRNNLIRGITGVLLYDNGIFVQLIEGELNAVRGLYYDSIVHDHRHRNSLLSWEHSITDRGFKNWQMGFVERSALNAILLPEMKHFIVDGFTGMDFTSPASAGRRFLLSIYDSLAKSYKSLPR